jgi:hypothetical protein
MNGSDFFTQIAAATDDETGYISFQTSSSVARKNMELCDCHQFSSLFITDLEGPHASLL